MLRGIVQVIVVFFFVRILFWFLRLVTAGSGSPNSGREPQRETAVPRRKAMRVDPSNVTDVPFTEIPAPGESARVDTQSSERIEAR